MARLHGPRAMRLLRFCLFNAISLLPRTNSLAIPSSLRCRHPRTIRLTTFLRNDLRDEIERSAQRRAYENRARGGGTGETVGGAILGGLLGGPFGALFGAQIGASFGAASSLDKARKEEMRRKGVTPEMLDQATEIGVALRQAVEALRATRESVDTSQQLAKTLDRQEKSLYERAKSAISSGDEEVARRLLLERESVKEKLLKILKSVSEDRKRLAIMESNVEALETRALEIESLLRRSVGASSWQDSANIGLSLEPEDPLLKKFRDLGM
ncbi:hypothetical protein ACHAW5_007877 [Stephanodiscus triporus]|uniref:Uncharacterized protein n=1 Tax=Stephanodiscus triporus TaxID=2934178 RepID=A0ABD3P7G9_9STRA